MSSRLDSENAGDKDLTNSVIGRAEEHLQAMDSSPFSPAAFGLLKGHIGQYMRELINESIRLGKRYRVDSISASHVERAANYLVSSPTRRFHRHLGTVGGILLGTSISSFVAMVNEAQYSAVGVLLSALLAMIGAFAVAVHIVRE